MPNYQYASEWLNFARKHLETAELLYRENHYPDIIAIELHQTIEKSFKAVLAFNGVRIIRSHNLLELHKLCNNYIDLSIQDTDSLMEINDYYEAERYPGPKYSLPEVNEIEKNLAISNQLYSSIASYIQKTPE
jgi:HEPN domain-containing protein